MGWSPWAAETWPHSVQYDGLRGFLLGEEIGGGRDRTVYGCRFDPSVVVKVELTLDARQNYADWLLWETVKDALASGPNRDVRRRFEEIQAWLAPCLYLSSGGSFLLMRRTTPIPANYPLPGRVPYFLFDLKRSNFGLLDGRVVCHDYGIVAPCLLNNTLCGTLRRSSLAMRKADWFT